MSADARAERVLLLLLIVLTMAVGAAAWSHPRVDPRPDATSIGTALVCDRNGCVER